jgi:hypothetical protein
MYGALFRRGNQMHNLLGKSTTKNMGQPIHFPALAPETVLPRCSTKLEIDQVLIFHLLCWSACAVDSHDVGMSSPPLLLAPTYPPCLPPLYTACVAIMQTRVFIPPASSKIAKTSQLRSTSTAPMSSSKRLCAEP